MEHPLTLFALPPPSPGFATFDELFLFLQAFHRDHSKCAIIKRSTKIDPDTGLGYTTLECDRNKPRRSKSQNIRSSSTAKVNCRYRISCIATHATNNQWVYKIIQPYHNHPPSTDPSEHPTLRRRSKKQKEVLAATIQDSGMKAQDIHTVLKIVGEDEHSYFTKKDIYNDVQAILRSQNGSASSHAPVQLSPLDPSSGRVTHIGHPPSSVNQLPPPSNPLPPPLGNGGVPGGLLCDPNLFNYTPHGHIPK
ncbi:hypothetical protein BROUX41_004625 [Berkeleyomyces rouxiae]|uniref:uncharacterized protein n=1 Tax=Berkeleyomyces rouxiae TaxID=2035830 RepID=UPI003B7F4C28